MSSKISAPEVLTEDQVSALIAQFRYMLIHEVKNMKLEVVESVGAMLARRSGIDRDIRDQATRVDLLAKMVKSFGRRLADLEKAQGISFIAKSGPLKNTRTIGKTRQKTPPAQQVDPPAPPVPVDPAHRRGRPPGTGRYEAYNAAKRERKAGDTT